MTVCIKQWERVFSCAEVARVRGEITWTKFPVARTGTGYRRLMRTPEGRTAYCVFIACVRLCARHRTGGVLSHNGVDFTAADISDEAGIPESECVTAFDLLSSPGVGWLSLDSESIGNRLPPVSEPAENHSPSISFLSPSSVSSSEGGLGETNPAPATLGKVRGPEAVAIPEPIDTERFRLKWSEWCAYRAEKRKPVSGRAAGAMLSKLAKFGEDVAVRSIDASIENDWQGVFPEKVGSNGSQQRRNVLRADGTRPGEFPQPDADDLPY